MNTYLRLLSYSKPYSRYVPAYIICVILAIIFGIVNFTFLIPVLNILFNQVAPEHVTSLPAFSISMDYLKNVFYYYFFDIITEHGRSGALIFVCLIIVCCSILANLFRYMSQRILADMRSNVLYKMRKHLFGHLSEMPLNFYHRHRKGNLMSMMSADMNEIENSVVSTFQVVFRDPLMIIGYYIVLFSLSFKLTIFSLFYLPLAMLLISFVSKRLKKEAYTSQQVLGDLSSTTEETLGGMKVIKAFNAEAQVQNQFNNHNRKLSNSIRSYLNRRELASPLNEFLGVAVIIGLLLYGGKLVLSNESSLQPSEFITYLILYSQILVPAKSLSNSFSMIQRGLAAAQRIFNITDLPKEEKEKGTHTIGVFNRSISFNNVSFNYGDTGVLHNINFIMPKGKVVALVGPSGSGKTTIADLLPRFFEINNGSIKIDDTDTKDVTLHSLRSLMGIVTQEPVLFHDTIYNNIAFGVTGVTEEQVTEAARIANAHDFITQAENGYQTIIGDRGVKLSGGQRQRISIARAVLKNPAVLILDEATSSLDTESERLVQEALFNLMKNRTSLVIAHRLSTIQAADEIIVLNKGEVIERGTHTQLIVQQGFYKKLVDLQMV